MLHITAQMEDQYFVAERKDGFWDTKTIDCVTGKVFVAEMSDQELGAVLALAVAGDFGESPLEEELRVFAEPVQNCNPEVRLIP